jgi:nucleotide-binding universal stress UspA family protein
MGRLICCVDDSEGARGALSVAQRLAANLGLQLVLLHVQPPTALPGVSAAPAGRERLREAELEDAERLLAGIAREAGLGEDVELRAELGDPAQRIVAACEEDPSVELVVIGSRGRGGIRKALLGSVSHAVAASAPCPCVVVPATAAGRPFLA